MISKICAQNSSHVNLPIKLLLLPSRAGPLKKELWNRVPRVDAEVKARKGMGRPR